uniref:Uncharacterized protein n=1 Tax=Amphiprion percula TaxID=161767 RepID=A0A3P8TJN3_AMPPE
MPEPHIYIIQQTLMLYHLNYCTFSVSADGSVKACGKGSYGRLGLGDSNNQSMPKKLKVLGLEGVSIQQITAGTSHSLAWTATLRRSTKLLKESSHDKQIIKKLHSKNNDMF